MGEGLRTISFEELLETRMFNKEKTGGTSCLVLIFRLFRQENVN